MKAIYKRELKNSFQNMTGFVITAGILLFMGIYCIVNNFIYGYANFEYAVSGMGLIYLFAAVFLTMGSLSTERRRKTDQLLLTSPASLTDIILGKYFAMLTVFAVPTLIMCLYPLILSFYGNIGFAAAYSAVFTLFMLGAALTAMGMFISSLTENMIISAAISLGAFLLIYFFSAISSVIPTTAAGSLVAFLIVAVLAAVVAYAMTHSISVSAIVLLVLAVGTVVTYKINSSLFEGLFPNVLSSVALFSRFSAVTSGMFDLTTIVLFLSVAVLFIVFTKESMEKRRWS